MLVFERRRDRLRQILREVSQAELARRAGIASTTFSRYLMDPEAPEARNIGEKNARKIESAAGKPEGWMDKQHPYEGSPQNPPLVARELSHSPWQALSLTWEEVMQSKQLPAQFMVAMPDDALAPRIPKGTMLVMTRGREPTVRQVILVRDARGAYYLRRYAQAPGGGWLAEALTDGYLTLRSDDAGVELVAVSTAIWAGAVLA